MKKFISLIILAVLLIMVTSCPHPDTPASETVYEKKVGIAMCTESQQRWKNDAENLKNQLVAAGYEVDLKYAGSSNSGDYGDQAVQNAQIEEMIAAGYKIIVVVPVNGNSVADCLQGVKASGVKIIDYERLIPNSNDLSYYVFWNNWTVGKVQGEYIENALNLKTATGPFYIEFFTGDANDPNVPDFFGGACEVLAPYITSGKLICKSGQTSKNQCATSGWSTANAENRMTSLIETYGYGPDTGDQRLDAVLSTNDTCAEGIINALLLADYTADTMPVITGQDCETGAVRRIINGTQSMSVLKDTRSEVTKIIEICNALTSGQTVTVDDTTHFNNGACNVPTCLCEPSVCTIDNYRSLLTGSQYYTDAQLDALEE